MSDPNYAAIADELRTLGDRLDAALTPDAGMEILKGLATTTEKAANRATALRKAAERRLAELQKAEQEAEQERIRADSELQKARRYGHLTHSTVASIRTRLSDLADLLRSDTHLNSPTNGGDSNAV